MQAWGCDSGTLTGRHPALTQCITEESCFSENADHTAYSETAGQDTCRTGAGQQDTTQIIRPRGIRRVGTFMVAQGCSATYEVLEEQCPRNPVLNEQSLYVFLSSLSIVRKLCAPSSRVLLAGRSRAVAIPTLCTAAIEHDQSVSTVLSVRKQQRMAAARRDTGRRRW